MALPTTLTSLNVTGEIQQNGTKLEEVAQTLKGKTIVPTQNVMKNIVMGYAAPVTRAEMVAGKVLIAGVAGYKIRVIGYKLIVTGAYNSATGGTSFILQDTNGTPVVITTALKAALTDGARISSYGAAITNVTDGAGMTGDLTADKGIAVKADAAWDGGTSILVQLLYMYV